MLLFVGLGNPGKAYAANRHNIGFMALDAIAREYRAPEFRSRFQGQTSEITIAGEKITLLKPETYMNESGRAVGEAARYYKIDLDKIVVF
ncbi:MAG TPA: aminoacyl-tRNA hydrolase, partial [Beijerinckia sp.]|nr:aminoacyl-tRNA hydrolase [Beijerinckia sp.]